jgi:hypothetical protein
MLTSIFLSNQGSQLPSGVGSSPLIQSAEQQLDFLSERLKTASASGCLLSSTVFLSNQGSQLPSGVGSSQTQILET